MAETFRSIETLRDFPETPEGWQRYWVTELDAADRAVEKWHEGGQKIVREYLDDRQESDRTAPYMTKLNYFWANVKTQKAMLFGQLPKVDVTRRHADADDDEARISGPIILNRLINTDIEQGVDGFEFALKYALFDFLTVGFGNAWVRYEVEYENVPARQDPMTGMNIPPTRRKKKENAAVDYHHWKNQRWSPCRIWEENRWVAKMVPMSRDSVERRWGPQVAARIPYEASTTQRKVDGQEPKDPWRRAEVWECWSKELRKVFWVVRGFDRVLEVKDDFLKLKNFWPCPRPMFDNWTTTSLMPRPSYALVQDLYNDINDLASRIKLLEGALRLAGIYDKSMGLDLNRLLLDRAYENIIIPVPNMAAFSEKGGFEGVIAYLPIQQIAEVIQALSQQLEAKQQVLYEMTGFADLTRGAPEQGVGDTTATERRMQGRYSNVRVQDVQDEVARFATELQNIRAEIMVKNYDEETILKRSNVLSTPDAPDAIAAIRALKADFPNYKIEIKSDDLAMQDFAALKQDRGEFLLALSTLMKDAVPAMEMFPQSAVVLLETVKWALAAFRGSASIEGVFDRAIKQAQEAISQGQEGGGGPPQPDPEVVKAQMKAQADAQKIQAKAQADAQKMQMQVDTERQRQEIQLQSNITETAMEAEIKARADERKAQMDAQRDAAKMRMQAAREAMRPAPAPGGKK